MFKLQGTPVFLLIFLINQFHCLYSTYRLDEETPSFAIHGINLDRLGSITIYGQNGSDFLIDFTQKDCSNEPDHFSKNRSSSYQSQIIPCLDPLPLSINGGIPEKDKCNEVMPYTLNFTKLLYMCSFKMPNTHKLTVKALEEAVSLDYSISFRVSQWVDEWSRVIVIPTDSIRNSLLYTSGAALVRENTIATIVLNPNTYRDLNGSGVTLELEVHYFKTDLDECGMFMAEETSCTWESSYAVYVGADPGMAKNPKHRIDDVSFLNRKDNYDLRSSVVSVFATIDSCSFCVEYAVMNGEERDVYPLQILSSYNYLWLFDDPMDFLDCQSVSLTPLVVGTGKWEFTIEFISIEGVQVNLTGWRDRLNTIYCLSPVIAYQESFEELPDAIQYFEGHCMKFDWCPLADHGERFGFAAIITWGRTEATKKDCHSTFELTEIEPQIIFDPYDMYIQNGYTMTKLICIVQKCPKDGDCSFLVDLSMNCESEMLTWCQTPSQQPFLEINNGIPEMRNCTMWEAPKRVASTAQCQLIVDDHVFFRSFPNDIMILLTSISVRSLQWSNVDEWRLVMLPDVPSEDDVTSSFALVYPPQSVSSWISMPLLVVEMQILQNFRSSHGLSTCEYRMIDGPPDPKGLHPDRHIFTFRDSERFVPQFLESELYSFHVPPGCSPSIGLLTLTVDDVFYKPQEICDGVSIIASHAYRNPFEYTTFQIHYYVNRTITCSSFNINVTVEIVALGNGNLTIEVDDSESEKRSVCPLDDGPPINCTLSEVSALRVIWVPKTQKLGDGCLIRVHISKSSLLFDQETQVTTTERNYRELSKGSTFIYFTLFLLSLWKIE